MPDAGWKSWEPAQRLEQLVRAPDALKLAARQLEVELQVPDCTGGG
jgi:hypothetical protein